MENFIYNNPTKILFGRGMEDKIAEEILPYGKRVMIHYGGGSIKKSGLLDKIVDLLIAADLEVFEFGGVVANPRVQLVDEAVAFCKVNKIDFILAIGGGSVIDSTKAIAAGSKLDVPLWDYITQGNRVCNCLPYGVILTLPGSGSEMNHACILNNEITGEKKGFTLPHPKFSILNPELMASAPREQIANGIVDMFSHAMEMYFTKSQNVLITDSLLEAVMKTIYELGATVYENPNDYDNASQIMWASTTAHNYSLGVGRIQEWTVHLIEHELSGLYDIPHARGLAIIMPAWMKHVYKEDVERFARFANKIFNVEVNFDNLEETALKGIKAYENWLNAFDMPKSLGDYDLIDVNFELIADRLTKNGSQDVGRFKSLSKADMMNILYVIK